MSRESLTSERGETLIEFALGSVIFLMTLFGTCWFGIGVWQLHNLLADLAQEGVRRASVCGSSTSLSATDCNISSYVSGRALGMGVSVTTSPSTLSTMNTGDTVMVTVSKSFTPGTTLIPHQALTLQASAKMIVGR